MAILYTNENVPLAVVNALRESGHDVLTSLDAGNANQAIADEDVLHFALAQGRTLLKNNRSDFHRLHRTKCIHAGIVTFTLDSNFVELATRIDACLSDAGATGRFLGKVTKGGYQIE